ncbi:hypothetical protein F1C58_02225 [Glaciihabitans sp. INWT7]|uniref:hypothetical protein n=1 Tax=Glaciihabitans sp. INWT7 TaxID=2596912 RepID=UPI001626132F|nr:hypothetical protein [Glaciihabitans sp. INWT7]QNE45840.1 hypothetical protein F1C58_02225 [Glaciihabitans sp. INWT7]
MTTVERTRQQLDPAGTTGVGPVAIFLAVGAFLYAVVMTIGGRAEISHPLFAVLALAFLAIAGAILIACSSPNRAPLTAASHAAVHSTAMAAIVCEAIGQAGSNAYIRDDWGPATLGILLVALGPYRPAREIAGGGLISAISIGIITYFEVPSLVTPGPPLAFIVLAVTPMLALSLSAAMFSKGVVASIERWQQRAQAASVSLVREFRDGIARSVQQDRVTILNRDVLPFFTEVLASDTITEVLASDTITDADRERARSIADSIRSVMVEEVDRSWLESLMELTGVERTSRRGAAGVVVEDPSRVAGAMSIGQRTAIRALLVALTNIPGFTRDHLRIVLSDYGGRGHGVITAHLPLGDSVLRSTFAPFLAVLRAVFTQLEVDFVHPELTLRFSYDRD